ncbi:hypothetical protein HGRIS_007202 [Hohenbuehelia grisea]|uniref:Uncharacterized protein n=1 Tax=Hohenbuehelia grisea TaxID=104357 RepID=A0ABR3JBH2_9AGAR
MAAPEINFAPVIDSKALPGTPAHEWANSTASALHERLESDTAPSTTYPSKQGEHPDAGSTKDFQTTTPFSVPQPTELASQPLASSASTPGVELPGAFPREAGDTGLISGDALANAKNQAYGVLEGAKSYLPAQEDVQRALLNAGETARQYLPESVASYLPGAQNISLPSSEHLGNQGESTGGVGALPGTISETSVTKLPEERVQAGIAAGGVGDLPGSNSETDVVKLPEERAVDGELKAIPSNNPAITTTTNKHATTSTPPHLTNTTSTETPKTGGVGELPGANSEVDVMRLPEERALDGGRLTPDTNTSGSSQDNANGIINSGAAPKSLLTTSQTPLLPGNATPSAASNASMKSNKVGAPPNTNLTPHTNGTTDASNTNLSTAAQAGSFPPTPTGLGGGIVAPAIASASAEHTSGNAPFKPYISVGAQSGAEDGVGKSDTALPPVPPKDSLAMGLAKHLSGPMKDDDDKMHGAFEREQPPVGNPNDLPSQRGGLGNSRGFSNTADIGHSSSAVGGHKRDESSSSMSTGGTPKKPGFMDKLKGEAKVISGKLGKNEEKVEEGRRMMGKV